MKKWFKNRRVIATVATVGALTQLGGCNLSDQQWASISQAVIQTGIITVITNVLDSAIGNTDENADGA